MRIIISGAGDVGFHLANLLAIEEHEIVVIDLSGSKLEYISQHLDVGTIKGSSTSFKTLKEANVAKADLVIAVTQFQDTNIATCIISKTMGASKTVARIQNTEFLYRKDILDHKQLGIDEIILPESLAAREIMILIE